MKPILIDAIFINTGGALSILKHLIQSMVSAGVDFVFLKDIRCPQITDEDKIKNIIIISPSLKDRHFFYKKHKNDFHSVLCMGNIPPTVKMPCKVHTYFHNLSVLVTPQTYSARFKFLFWIKRQIIRICRKNTDSWIVQTTNTENVIKKVLCVNKPIYVYPIYSIPSIKNTLSTSKRSDYLFIGDYTYSKGHDILLDAWEKLHKMGRNPILHLTVTRKPGTIPFCDKMDNLINNKVNIINHGFMPYNEACKLYAISKAVVYPSLLESLGLGLVEGISAGCDVITANLPYAHSICKPSETFNPTDSDSIVNAILRYEEGNSPKSELTIHDCVNELLNLIYSKL